MVRTRKAKNTASGNDVVPEIYRNMLADAVASSPALTDDEGRTLKRRRVGGRIVTKKTEGPVQQQQPSTDQDDDMRDFFKEDVLRRPPVIKTESEDSADSDMDWEEINLQQHDEAHQKPSGEDGEQTELNLVLGADDDQTIPAQRRPQRRPLTALEKKLRLEIHKMHLCCLLVHVYIRNHWCDDAVVHMILRDILTKKTISYLNPDEDKSQFQRSRSFMDGLEQASEAFRARFSITARGMSKPRWAESPEALARSELPTDLDLPMQKEDFRSAAQELSASRDVGSQLFCALLRSVGVDARLVCSLQALAFNSAPMSAVPQVKYAAFYSAESKARDSTPELNDNSDCDDEQGSAAKPAIGSLGGRNRFESDKQDTSNSSSKRLPVHPKRPIRESKFPVYWVEVFNEAAQRWIPVDPLVTKTIAKTRKFEPPAGDRENNMSYVIAFEGDGSARDVTRRYTKAYNAKTRRDRVESTKGGDRWWRRVMRIYRRRHHLDRDQVDDADLTQKEAAEPMPRNVQDFKNHPYYALERHLKRNEVIEPKREVGKIGTGSSRSSTVLESIYRRRDVHKCHSGDKWYRMGREIKPGEQPLKRVAARRARDQSIDPEDQDEENAGTALYAVHQTTFYIAPPVKNGRIPKNMYGNLDVYVPSMVPPGGSHVEHAETSRAAKILGIDFADAVTGFVFKGRHGTAVTKGAVVASEYREAVLEVVSAFEDERVRAEEERRSHEALRAWKRFLAGLRIRQRIEGYDIEGERDATQGAKDRVNEEEEDGEGGGFFPGQKAEGIAEPTAGRQFEQQAAMDMDQEESGGGFMADDAEDEEASLQRQPRDQFLDNLDEDSGGGFLIDDDHDEDAEQALQEAMVVDTSTQVVWPVPVQARENSHAKPAETILYKNGNDSIEARSVEVNDFASVSPPAQSPSTDIGHELDHPTQGLHTELTSEELEEARQLQQLYEAGPAQPESQGEAAAKPKGVPALQNILEPPVALTPLPSKPPPQEVVPEPESPKSDKGSLLSEDPEDADAEPDWLT